MFKYAIITSDAELSPWQRDCVRNLEQVGQAQLQRVFFCSKGSRHRLGKPLKLDSLSASQDELTALNVDFMLLWAPRAVGFHFASQAKFGVWYFAHSDIERFYSDEPYFWEIYNADAVSGAALLQLRSEDVAGVVLKSGFFPAYRQSYETTLALIHDAIAEWPAQVCREIRENVADYFNDLPAPNPPKTYGLPNDLQRLRFKWILAQKRFLNRWQNRLYKIYWNIGKANRSFDELRSCDSRVDPIPLLPHTEGEFAADPYVLVSGDETYIFYERYFHRTDLGHIAVSQLEAGRLGPPRAAIEEPFHLSYPQLLEHGGEIYCIPESAAVKKVILYRAIDFPYRWEKAHTLLEGFAAQDSTILQFDDTWWLFCTNMDQGYNSHLHIWYAAELTGPWHPHPRNPVKIDVRSANCAGPIIASGGVLYRPGQDCARHYGSRVVINEIQSLTRRAYQERVVATIGPSSDSAYSRGLHTITSLGDDFVVDMLRYQFEPSAIRDIPKTALKDIMLSLGVPEISIRNLKSKLGLSAREDEL